MYVAEYVQFGLGIPITLETLLTGNRARWRTRRTHRLELRSVPFAPDQWSMLADAFYARDPNHPVPSRPYCIVRFDQMGIDINALCLDDFTHDGTSLLMWVHDVVRAQSTYVTGEFDMVDVPLADFMSMKLLIRSDTIVSISEFRARMQLHLELESDTVSANASFPPTVRVPLKRGARDIVVARTYKDPYFPVRIDCASLLNVA